LLGIHGRDFDRNQNKSINAKMKKLLIGIGVIASVVGAQGQGYFNPATRGTAGGLANDAQAVVLNYYKGATFSFTSKGTNYVVNDMVGFIPGTTAGNSMGALGNTGVASQDTAMFNLGATPTNGKAFSAALYIGAKGEQNPANFVKAGSNAWFSVGSAAPGYLLTSSGAGTARRTAGVNGVSGLSLSFEAGQEMSAQIRAWIAVGDGDSEASKQYTSYEQFMAAVLAGNAVGYAGMTAPQDTTSSAQTPLRGFSNLQGPWYLYPVPEPSVVGLGLLGLAGMFFIRRRK
jgi:hypothetical protein